MKTQISTTETTIIDSCSCLQTIFIRSGYEPVVRCLTFSMRPLHSVSTYFCPHPKFNCQISRSAGCDVFAKLQNMISRKLTIILMQNQLCPSTPLSNFLLKKVYVIGPSSFMINILPLY